MEPFKALPNPLLELLFHLINKDTPSWSGIAPKKTKRSGGELTAEQCAKFTALESHYKRLERVLGKIPQEELGKLLPKRMGYRRITHI